MAKVGEVRAKMVVDDKEWTPGINRVEAGFAGLGVKIESAAGAMQGELRKTTAELNATAKGTEAAVKQMAFADKMQAGVAVLGQVTGAISGFRAEITAAGDEADDLRDRLAATFGELSDEKAKLSEQQMVLGFKPDEIANSLVTLKKFGQDGATELKRLEDAARFTNQPVTDLAEAFGKFEKFQDAKSVKAYQKAIGASAKDLEGYGAKLKDANTVLLDNEASIKLAADALRKYEQANFEGAAERQADATTHLKGEMDLLKREIGASAVAFTESFSPAILGAVQSLRGLPDGIKAAIGVGVEIVGVGATVGASVLQFGANVAIMVQGMGGLAGAKIALASASGTLQTALTALTGTLGLTLGVVGLVGLAFAGYTAYLQANTAAEEERLQKAEKGLKLYRAQRDVINEAASAVKQYGSDTSQAVDQVVTALKRLGKDDLDVTKGIAANSQLIQQLTEKAAELRNSIDQDKHDQADALDKEIAKLEERNAVLRHARADPQLAGTHQAEVDAAAKKDAALSKEQEKAQQLLAIYKEKSKANIFTNDKEQLALLDRVLAAIGTQDAAYHELALSRVSLARKAAEEEKKAADDVRKGNLDERLNDIKVEAAAGRLSKQGEIVALQQVLAAYGDNAQVRRQLELQVAQLQGQLLNEGVQKHQQAEAKKTATEEKEARERASRVAKAKADAERKAAAEEAQKKVDTGQIQGFAKETVAAQRKAIDSELHGLEADIGKKTVMPQIEALLNKSRDLQIAEIKAERDAAIASTKNEQVKVAATQAAEAKIQAVRADTTEKLKVEVDKQKTALQSLADKHTAVTAQIKQNEITTQVGGKNSPLYSDVNQGLGINLGNFDLGGIKKQPADPQIKRAPDPSTVSTKPGDPVPTVKPQSPTPPANAPAPPGGDVGAQVAAAFKASPLVINVQVQANGKAAGQTSFSGTASQLAAATNLFNADFTLGVP